MRAPLMVEIDFLNARNLARRADVNDQRPVGEEDVPVVDSRRECLANQLRDDAAGNRPGKDAGRCVSRSMKGVNSVELLGDTSLEVSTDRTREGRWSGRGEGLDDIDGVTP